MINKIQKIKEAYEQGSEFSGICISRALCGGHLGSLEDKLGSLSAGMPLNYGRTQRCAFYVGYMLEFEKRKADIHNELTTNERRYE